MKICSVAGTKIKGGFVLPPLEEIEILKGRKKYIIEIEFGRNVTDKQIEKILDNVHLAIHGFVRPR